MYLILCFDGDLPALWAHGRLRDAGLGPLELVTAACRSIAEPDRGGRGLGAEVAIRKGVDGIFPTHEHGKDLAVGPGYWIEGLDRALPCRDGIEAAQAGGRILDLSQGIEIPRVALEGDVAIPEEVGHTLPERDPFGASAPAATDPPGR